MNEDSNYIGGKIFSQIKVDDRVTSDLKHCLYCQVTSRNPNGTLSSFDYKLPLNSLNEFMAQCPSCKRIYLLRDELV